MFESNLWADPLTTYPELAAAVAQVPAPAADTDPLQAGAQLLALVVLQRRLHAVVLHHVRAFDANGHAVACGSSSTQAWVAAHAALDPGQAASLVGTATLVQTLPEVGERATRGEIGLEHLAALQRATRYVPAEVLAEHDQVLTELAESAHPRDLMRAGERITDVWQHDLLATDPTAALQLRRVTLAQTIEGIWSLEGQLTPEDGAKLAAALEPLMRKRGPEDDRTPVQRRADALAELVDLALSAGTLPRTNGDRTRLTVLVQLTEQALDAVPGDPGVHVDGPTPALAVVPPVVPPDNLFDRARVAAMFGNGSARQLLGSHMTLSPEALRRLGCDADVELAVCSPNGDLLYLGRTTRFPNLAQKRALVVRDGGCVFPGCDRPPGACQAHHLIWWSRLGPTDIDNLALVCGFHHLLIHEHSWTLERVPVDATMPYGGWVATSPYGLVLRRLRQPAA